MKYTDEMKKKEFEKIEQYFKERNYELLSNEFITYVKNTRDFSHGMN